VFGQFEKYIIERANLNLEELELMRSLSVQKTIKKKQFLLKEGEICRNHSFISKGLLVSYRVDQDGIEHVLSFTFEDWWASDQESLFNTSPSKMNIEALEDSEVVMWTKNNFDQLKNDIPKLKKFVNNLTEKSLHASQNRIYSFISQTTEEKYERFIRNYPDLFQRVPLHRIASYLGVSREMLTRIRSQSNQNGKT
jgi:CRP-like cAMP-binding protein